MLPKGSSSFLSSPSISSATIGLKSPEPQSPRSPVVDTGEAAWDDMAARARGLNLAGRYKETVERFGDEAARARDCGSPRLPHEVGAACSCLPDDGSRDRAAQLLGAAVERYDPEKHSRWMADALADLVLLYESLGAARLAADHHGRGLELAGSDSRVSLRLLRQLPLFLDLPKAERRLDHAADGARYHGLPREEACILNNRGNLLRRLGRRFEAHRCFVTSHRLFGKLAGDCRDVPLNNLGVLDLEDGDPGSAERRLREALALAGPSSASLSVESNLAVALIHQGKDGLSLLWDLYDRALKLKDPFYLHPIAYNLGRRLLLAGEAGKAVEVVKLHPPPARNPQEPAWECRLKIARHSSLLWRVCIEAGVEAPRALFDQARLLDSGDLQEHEVDLYRERAWILSPIDLL